MAGFIARQPNGFICRHSTVCDCVTDYNMTEEEFQRIFRKCKSFEEYRKGVDNERKENP